MGHGRRDLVFPWNTRIFNHIKTVRFYEVGENAVKPSELKAKFDHRAAILACAFNADGTKGFSGGLDASLRE